MFKLILFVWLKSINKTTNVYFLHEQVNKDVEERSPEKEKRKAKVRGDERKERKMSRKRVSIFT